jgi:hypothetical protein
LASHCLSSLVWAVYVKVYAKIAASAREEWQLTVVEYGAKIGPNIEEG